MKAAVLYEPNTPLRIEGFELPETGHSHVRVRLVASGVCYWPLTPQSFLNCSS